MEYLGVVLLGFGTIVIAVLGKVLADEISEALPTLSKWLLLRAVRRVPQERREAFVASIVERLDVWPGKLGKFLIALKLVWENREQVKVIRPRKKDSLFGRIVRVSLLACLLLVFAVPTIFSPSYSVILGPSSFSVLLDVANMAILFVLIYLVSSILFTSLLRERLHTDLEN
jgi:hypothetical protein